MPAMETIFGNNCGSLRTDIKVHIEMYAYTIDMASVATSAFQAITVRPKKNTGTDVSISTKLALT